MDIDPQKVIEIMARRIASEVIANAMKEAAIESLTQAEPKTPKESP